MLDRIDLYLQMDEVSADDKSDVASEAMQETVLRVFETQISRAQSELNGKLGDEEIAKFCVCDDEASGALDHATQRFSLSRRAINKTLKVARTIADIEGSRIIKKPHILEALSYRVKQEGV